MTDFIPDTPFTEGTLSIEIAPSAGRTDAIANISVHLSRFSKIAAISQDHLISSAASQSILNLLDWLAGEVRTAKIIYLAVAARLFRSVILRYQHDTSRGDVRLDGGNQSQ
jgi:hypothetical protein